MSDKTQCLQFAHVLLINLTLKKNIEFFNILNLPKKFDNKHKFNEPRGLTCLLTGGIVCWSGPS